MDLYELLLSPNDIQRSIVKRYRAMRKSQHLSQKTLASRSGVSLGSIKRFESTGEISLFHLVKIAFALGCQQDFDFLFQRPSFQTIQEVIDAAAREDW